MWRISLVPILLLTLFKVADPVENSQDPAFIIPVVFHVVHHEEVENIPDNLIWQHFKVFQQDFLAQNPDLDEVPKVFREHIGNPNISFVPAEHDEKGAPISAIRRVHTDIDLFEYDERDVFYESPIVEPEQYLNVYICDLNRNGVTPTKAKRAHNGVVLDYTRFLKPNRTLTHEVGHWLGLKHIFEGGRKDLDGVADTPAQRKHSHYCPNHPKKEYGQPVMFMNFMDYSQCRSFFTRGQVEVMHQTLEERFHPTVKGKGKSKAEGDAAER